MRQGEFNCGATAPDGSAWEIEGEIYERNPRLLLKPQDYEMITLWRMFQGSTGIGILPEAGGVMDQCAIMLDAFAFMNGVEARLKKGN